MLGDGSRTIHHEMLGDGSRTICHEMLGDGPRAHPLSHVFVGNTWWHTHPTGWDLRFAVLFLRPFGGGRVVHLVWTLEDFSEHFLVPVICAIQIQIQPLSRAASNWVSMEHEFAISDPLFRRPAKQINGNIRLNLARLKRTMNSISEAIKPTGMLGIKSKKNSFQYFIFAVQMLLLPWSMKTRRQKMNCCVPFQANGLEAPSGIPSVSAGVTPPLGNEFCAKPLQGCQHKI